MGDISPSFSSNSKLTLTLNSTSLSMTTSDIVLVNISFEEVSELFIATTDSEYWGVNQLPGELPSSNYVYVSNIPCDEEYDFLIKNNSGQETQITNKYLLCDYNYSLIVELDQ